MSYGICKAPGPGEQWPCAEGMTFGQISQVRGKILTRAQVQEGWRELVDGYLCLGCHHLLIRAAERLFGRLRAPRTNADRLERVVSLVDARVGVKSSDEPCLRWGPGFEEFEILSLSLKLKLGVFASAAFPHPQHTMGRSAGWFATPLPSEEFNRSVWGLTSIASAVWLFKRENVRAAHLDGLLFPFGPQTGNP